jgi:hypothetical protein
MAVSDWSHVSLPWFEELTALEDRIGILFRRAEPRRQVGLFSDRRRRAQEWLAIGGIRGRSCAMADAGASRPDDMGSREGPGHMPGLCDRASRRSIRCPGFGRDGILEEGQPFGRGCTSIQRHSRTDRELSDRRFSRLCGSEWAKAASIPDDVTFATTKIGIAMVAAALDAGVQVLGESVYGSDELARHARMP